MKTMHFENPSSLKQAPLSKAFSLVEVTLALGILSFCMISIMGLLPTALNVSRKAIEKNIETRIIQTIRADMLQRPYTGIPDSGAYYFDDDGYELSTASDAHYTAEFTNTDDIILPDSQTNTAMKTCAVTITNQYRNDQTPSSYAILIPDNGF